MPPLAVSKEETVNAFRKITGTFGQPEHILHFEGYVKTAAWPQVGRVKKQFLLGWFAKFLATMIRYHLWEFVPIYSSLKRRQLGYLVTTTIVPDFRNYSNSHGGSPGGSHGSSHYFHLDCHGNEPWWFTDDLQRFTTIYPCPNFPIGGCSYGFPLGCPYIFHDSHDFPIGFPMGFPQAWWAQA